MLGGEAARRGGPERISERNKGVSSDRHRFEDQLIVTRPERPGARGQERFDIFFRHAPAESGSFDLGQVKLVFGGHPTKIRAEEFWDLNFYGGKNTPPEKWVMPRLRPQETMATAQKNFRRMMRWIGDRRDIEITTYRALMDVYGRQKEIIGRKDLRDMARRAGRDHELAAALVLIRLVTRGRTRSGQNSDLRAEELGSST